MHTHLDSLPHAYPFRMLDKVVELSEGVGIGIKNFSAGDFFSPGCGGLDSIVPDFMVIEAMAQLSGLILNFGEDRAKSAFLVQIKTLRFLKSVCVADTVKIFSVMEDNFGPLAGFSVKAVVGTVNVAVGELIMARV